MTDITAPPVVEFVNVAMEFHDQGPRPPSGEIKMDLNSRDANGNPNQQVFTVMQGVWSRLRVQFKVHNNACVGLKCVTGVKAMK